MVMGVSQQNCTICVVAICKECRQGVIFKYVKPVSSIPTGSGYTVLTSGMPLRDMKPDIEWCDCGSDEPRYLCKVNEDDTPGLLDKCEKCEFKFACATSRIEVIYNGYK
uniref:Uncharacterized protein n=2 Tax=viral metagenome TaxID=1070528 RepID=A0A6M3KW53_9ZZZZ